MVVRIPAEGSAGHRLDSIDTMPLVSDPIESKNDTDWLLLTESVLDVGVAYDWAVRPNCGAVVLFSGTVRDHAEGRDGVQHLTYEAYESQVLARFSEIVGEARSRWPGTGRVVIWHRTGQLGVEESTVITVVSAPHRAEAFEAGRFTIDALKESAPIWKHEVWAGGADWGTGAHVLAPAGDVRPGADHGGGS